MADIGITKYRARVIKENALPSNPGNPATNPVDPVNPPASGGGTGVNQFIQLTDTPATYSGATLNYARVNAGETGLEFRTPAQVLTDIGGIGGTIASGQVAFGTGSGTIGGDSTSGEFTYSTNKRLTLRATTGTPIINLFNDGASGGSSTFYIIPQAFGTAFIAYRNKLSFGTTPTINSDVTAIATFDNLGKLGLLTTSPTNTLDINGTTRIRTINNLGSTPTEVLVPSATGVVSKRTLAEFVGDLGVVESINAGAGIQVNPNPTASTPQVALTGQALSFHSLTGDGFVYRTSGIVGVRTLTAGTGITITNGDGVAGNPVISAGSKLELWTNQTVLTTYANLNTDSGSNSFSDTDLPTGRVYKLIIKAVDYVGNPVQGSTMFIRIFGREYEIINPGIAEDLWATYCYEVLIIAGSGSANSRSITTKIITMGSSMFADFFPMAGSPWFAIQGSGNYTNTDTVDLTTSKTIEVKMTSIDGALIITQASCKKIN